MKGCQARSRRLDEGQTRPWAHSVSSVPKDRSLLPLQRGVQGGMRMWRAPSTAENETACAASPESWPFAKETDAHSNGRPARHALIARGHGHTMHRGRYPVARIDSLASPTITFPGGPAMLQGDRPIRGAG